MPAARKTTRTVTVTEWADDEPAAPFADEGPLAPAFDEAAPDICPHCGELLVWHEPTTCQPVAPTEARLVAPTRPSGSFAYELGHRVQPMPALTAQVIWRGQLKERHPATGLVHRVNVYRLNDGHWDCYREEELQAA